jgi:hypothetical protein
MAEALKLPRFSVGVGDRFAHQAKAQLAACIKAGEAGVEVVPVWNKSNREHTIIGTEPSQTRAAADAAVKELGWKLPYFLDADHINLKTVERFLSRATSLRWMWPMRLASPPSRRMWTRLWRGIRS